MAEISKITLPSGTTYDIKDTTARNRANEAYNLAAAGIQYIIAWDGKSAPQASKIPDTTSVEYNGTITSGTLEPSANTVGKIYLVAMNGGSSVISQNFTEFVTIKDSGQGRQYEWEALGDTKIDISDLFLLKGDGENALTSATTASASSSSVSFSGGTTDVVLGEATTFTSSTPTITVNKTSKYIKATASGAAVTPKVESIKVLQQGSFEYLHKTSIKEVDGNTNVSIPNVTGNTEVSIPNVTSAGSASSWQFNVSNETLTISGSNSTAPTLGTALKASKVTLGTALQASKVTTKTTQVADATLTGTSDENAGDAVAASIVEGSVSVVTGITSVTQPSVSLAVETAAGTGRVAVLTDASATSSQPTIAVGTNDKVTAVKTIGTATAAAQTITLNKQTVKVAKYDDLELSN